MTDERVPTDSKSLNDALDMLSEISERARELGLGLAEYPVDDVERVVAVLSAGKVKPRAVEQVKP